jgi:hypothetical protein
MTANGKPQTRERWPNGRPDDARLTDRGIEWLDEDGVHHVVPWTAVVEFIGPPPTPPTPI